MLEDRAVAESGGTGIEEYEKDVARGGPAAKRVKMVALHFERRNLLRLEFGFHRSRIELAEGDADDVVRAAAADVGPGDFFYLRVWVHAGGTQKLFELAEFRRKHPAGEMLEPGEIAPG